MPLEQALTNVRVTQKQIYVMNVLIMGNEDGSWIDLDQLAERLPYQPTKQALQFSVRALIQSGMIEKKGTENRRGRRRRLLGPTREGYRLFQRGFRESREIEEYLP